MSQGDNMLGKPQALDDAIAEVIDWIANEKSKEARNNGDTDMVDAYAQIISVLKDHRHK